MIHFGKIGLALVATACISGASTEAKAMDEYAQKSHTVKASYFTVFPDDSSIGVAKQQAFRNMVEASKAPPLERSKLPGMIPVRLNIVSTDPKPVSPVTAEDLRKTRYVR
ncbi:MAG TPA: hypothetical protein VGL56_14925 [Fimbriimonadaceae bacterium]|jgi:uncharacterized heparinase superfamily protein